MKVVLPKGSHQAHPASMTIYQGTEEDPREYVLIFFEVTRGKYEGEKRARRYYMHTDKGAAFAFDVLRTCGCTFPDGDPLSREGFGSDDVRIIIEHDRRNGVTYDNIKWVNPLLSSGGGSMSDDSKQGFRARFAHLVGDAGAPASDTDNSDVPF